MQKLKCPYCSLETIPASLPKHLRVAHNKTKTDYLLFTLGKTKEDIPLCPICQKEVCESDLFSFKETCGSPDCKKQLTHQKKSAATIAMHKRLIAEGKHNFQKQNREYDENGKCLMNLKAAQSAVKSGKCSFLSKNRPRDEEGNDLLAKKVAAVQIEKGTFFGGHDKMSEHATERNLKRSEAGTHQWLKQNLLLDENGKSVSHLKAYQTIKESGIELDPWEGHNLHPDDLNREFLIKHFIKDNRFNLDECCSYFNLSVSRINLMKRRFEIYTPNISNAHVLQDQIFDYIRSFYDKEIHCSIRNVIPSYELDIYLPEAKLAIEFDGLKFHSSGVNPFGEKVIFPKNYHLNKTELCEKQGIQLLHITDSEWLSPKQHIWKSVIKSKLGVTTRIGARKCQIIKNVSNIKSFLEQNHLQGYAPSSFNYGLTYDGKTVAVMTFNKVRFGNKVDFELMRFCCECGITIQGAASRLLKAFREDHPGSIVSYANRRWSNGNLYKQLGFTFDGKTEPDYFYFHPKDYQLYHRISFQKHKLKELPGFNYNENLTEEENMYANGYMKYYDCGNLRYIG
ncbi:MAG: hypothetical protein MJZ34_02835 [Paludibacteraceae bacterium]|nr:hypothetical protein [Paludibacteraceae bacterium]